MGFFLVYEQKQHIQVNLVDTGLIRNLTLLNEESAIWFTSYHGR